MRFLVLDQQPFDATLLATLHDTISTQLPHVPIQVLKAGSLPAFERAGRSTIHTIGNEVFLNEILLHLVAAVVRARNDANGAIMHFVRRAIAKL